MGSSGSAMAAVLFVDAFGGKAESDEVQPDEISASGFA